MVENDLRVDPTTIEKQLSDLWRQEKQDGSEAVTKAALWNVVAHTWNAKHHAHATEVLARVSASVPQRTIIVEADPHGADDMQSWISANCHLIGGGRQVCSEEVSIRAAGERVSYVPPLVNALLLPNMPVALWWVGDLPDQLDYAEALLDPADRLIVDSAQFDSVADLDLVSRIADHTTTAPADLNWARLDEWRAATATLFDPPPMRERLGAIRRVRVTVGGGQTFGARSEAMLYVSWMMAQTGTDFDFDFVSEGSDDGIGSVEIHFNDDAIALVRGDRERGVVLANSDGSEQALDCVTRALDRATEQLIVRLLKKPEADRVYLKTLKAARRLAR